MFPHFTGQRVTTLCKFCCYYFHLDLLEYKSGLFPVCYIWIGEPKHAILHHAELFSELYKQDYYHSLSSLIFIPSAAGCSTGNRSELKFMHSHVRTLYPKKPRADVPMTASGTFIFMPSSAMRKAPGKQMASDTTVLAIGC